ncbi:MAG: hypothetical protein FIB00_14330 [Chloroflexi bacterium]|nr:hypothetical protein [Chloroflexota bacterium]
MNRWIRMPFILPFLMVLAACAGKQGAGGGDRVDLNVLTSEQIIRYPNAFLAVQTMRSQWLRGHAPGDLSTTGGAVKVYRDGLSVGGVETLQSMSTEGIAYIRFFNGIQASQRWGLGHENGVIYVSSQAGVER